MNRRRAAPTIVSALLGMVILTEVTQVAGRVSVEPGAAPQMTQQLENHPPPGRLRVLTGIIAYTDPRQGFVIIGSSVEDTHLARPGDHLPDGSSIREIYPQHVVLEYGGRLETLGIHERGEPAWVAQAPRPTDEPRSDLRPVDIRAGGMTVDERRSYDPQSTNARQEQAEPEAPSPFALDPADEPSNGRRQRAASRVK
jgi:type II secretory pathway component PulC